MQLVIDPATGDVLKGRGNGSLNLSISPSNDLFTIYGDYDITEGSYKFTLRNIVARTFSLEPGSSIRWTGTRSTRRSTLPPHTNSKRRFRG